MPERSFKQVFLFTGRTDRPDALIWAPKQLCHLFKNPQLCFGGKQGLVVQELCHDTAHRPHVNGFCIGLQTKQNFWSPAAKALFSLFLGTMLAQLTKLS